MEGTEEERTWKELAFTYEKNFHTTNRKTLSKQQSGYIRLHSLEPFK